MKKKIVIVGAGITGIVIAKILSSKNFKIHLYEKNLKIGGVMRDFEIENKSFLIGPQFLDHETDWVKLFFNETELKKKFIFFDEDAYSYTDLFEKHQIKSNTNQPMVNYKIKDIKLNNKIKIFEKKKSKSLKDRLELYPKKISKKLLEWSRNFTNEIHLLDESTSKIYGKRVVFKKNTKELYKLKKNKTFNEIYGKTSEIRAKFILPKEGYNKFFNEISEKLTDSNVKLITNSRLKIDENRDLFNYNKRIKYDYIIWTGNPIPLLESYNKKIDNKILKVQIYFAKIKNINNINCTYINVYSLKTKIFRIYIYKKGNDTQMSVETFFSRLNEDKDIFEQAIKILKKLNYKIIIDSKIYKKSEIRHIFLTKKDLVIFKKFKKILPKNLIDGMWEKNLDRDQKLSLYPNYILDRIKI